MVWLSYLWEKLCCLWFSLPSLLPDWDGAGRGGLCSYCWAWLAVWHSACRFFCTCRLGKEIWASDRENNSGLRDYGSVFFNPLIAKSLSRFANSRQWDWILSITTKDRMSLEEVAQTSLLVRAMASSRATLGKYACENFPLAKTGSD